MDSNIELAGKIIDLMRANGLTIESPYDVENFVEEYLTNHSNLWETGRFEEK